MVMLRLRFERGVTFVVLQCYSIVMPRPVAEEVEENQASSSAPGNPVRLSCLFYITQGESLEFCSHPLKPLSLAGPSSQPPTGDQEAVG